MANHGQLQHTTVRFAAAAAKLFGIAMQHPVFRDRLNRDGILRSGERLS